VLGSKADVAAVDFDRADVLRISAVARQGLDELLGRIGNLVDEARHAEPEPEPFVVLRPAEEGFAVVRDDDGAWRVTGRTAERVVAMADLTNIEAMEYVQHRLRKMGVDRALHRAGAREGDLVRIGPVELDYMEGLG
jgi:GTP-binding protein